MDPDTQGIVFLGRSDGVSTHLVMMSSADFALPNTDRPSYQGYDSEAQKFTTPSSHSPISRILSALVNEDHTIVMSESYYL